MSLKKRKPSKKPSQNYSRVYETFAGHKLVFLLKHVRGSSAGAILNVTFEGYLLDECDKFYYIGNEPTEVTGALPKDGVASMIISTDDTDSFELEIPEGRQH